MSLDPVQQLAADYVLGTLSAGQRIEVEETKVSQMQLHLRDTAREIHPDRWVVRRTIRKHIHEAGNGTVHRYPVIHRRPPDSRGVCNRRNMEQQIRGATARRMNEHCVPEGCFGENIPRRDAFCDGINKRIRGVARELKPDRLTAWSKRRVRNRKAKRFGDGLCGSRGSEELTSAAGRRAGPAARFGGFL